MKTEKQHKEHKEHKEQWEQEARNVSAVGIKYAPQVISQKQKGQLKPH